MRLVVDTNILLSGLLREGATRELLLHAPLGLYAPEWLREEIERHFPAVVDRSLIPESTVSIVLERLLERVQFVPEAALAPHAAQALERCRRSGSKDAPYVACCLAVDADLWTHDRRLGHESGVKVVTTGELVRLFL